MKTPLTIVLVAFTASLSATAIAANEHENHNMGSMHTQTATPMSATLVDGTVKKVDKAAGKVTLAHGPLKNLGMDMGMTMAFRVKDASWLDKMKEGDKIRFGAEVINGVYTVVQFEPAK